MIRKLSKGSYYDYKTIKGKVIVIRNHQMQRLGDQKVIKDKGMLIRKQLNEMK
jgi:hypothetical protein